MKSFIFYLQLACLIVRRSNSSWVWPDREGEQKDRSETCKALVLSGGAVNGAWEVGVLYTLAHSNSTADDSFDYDVVSGVSAGAINSAAFALFPIGQEGRATDFLKETWSNITSSDLFESHFYSWVTALWSESVYSTEPALEYLRNLLSEHP